jgi:DNA modification methylase
MNILGQNDKKERVGYDTQKPLSLVERIIKSSTDEGDLVLDVYLGSGTTAVACKNLGRRFIGCDINQRAIDITLSRL